MYIKTKKIKFDDEVSYKETQFEYCCDKMEDNDAIVLGNEYDEFEYEGVYSVKLMKTDVNYGVYDDDYTSEDYRYYKIDFCPFCGEKIVIEVVEEVDLSEEYFNLKEQRDEHWDECRKTDSKKKENELREIVHELDRRINDFYKSDGF